MTSMTMVEGAGSKGWGEARERARTRRRFRVGGVMIVAVAAVALTQPALRGWVETVPGMGGRAPAISGVIEGALISLVAAVGGLVIWLRLDEVQRRRATNSWATAGIVGYILYPVARQAAPLLGWAEPGHVIWQVMFVTVVSAQLWQRWRD